jgi:hypothetical protein
MEEINALAKKEFSGQAFTNLEYEELMRLSSNFTLSFQAVWDIRHKSILLCQKSGDLIKFYLKQRKMLTTTPE